MSPVRTPRFPYSRPSWPATLERPAPERHVGVEFDHEWSRRYPVRLARAVVLDNLTRPLTRLVAPTTVRGGEHLAQVTAPVVDVAASQLLTSTGWPATPPVAFPLLFGVGALVDASVGTPPAIFAPLRSPIGEELLPVVRTARKPAGGA